MADKPLFALDFLGTAIIADDGCEVSYAELKRLADDWAASIPPRSLVFLLVGNDLGSLVSYVACLNHGIVPLMLNEDIDAAILSNLEETYHPFAIYKNGIQIKHHSSDFASQSDLRSVDISTNLKSNNSPALHPDLALLITTSGSTGSPKLVRQSYKNIAANTASIIEYLKLDAMERPITTLPMNYVYGLSIINTHLKIGATLLMTKHGIMDREFWKFFTEQGATSFGGVPYTYEMLDRLMFFRRKLPSLRTMTQAGGKILPELHQKFAEYAAKEGKNFVVMYGAAEATSRMGYLPPERALDKVGSMGIAIPGGSFELVEGELVYTGDNVTLGYAETAADLAKGDERGGRYVTGDMARVDEEGFYYIIGRKKRFLKIFGNRVSLDETERMIKGAFPDIDCACVGTDDHMRIYLHPANQAISNQTIKQLLDAVHQFVSEKTRLNPSAFEVVEIDKIPKNASGKTLYTQLFN